jgi:single-strand DNA-binding protein
MDKPFEVFFGRLGRNPDLRYTPKQTPVCYLSLAVSKNGLVPPDWKRVIVWGKQAETCNLYLKKGAEVFVHGQSQLREFKDREGNIREIEEVKARLVGFSSL